MASKPLCLVSAGHRPSGRRETNHSNQQNNAHKVNRNGNSNRNRNWSTPKRNPNQVPFPSGAKYDSYLDDSDLSLTPGKGGKKGKGKSINHLLSFQSYEETDENKNNRKKTGRTTLGSSKGYRGSHGKEDYLQATAQFIIDKESSLELEPFSVDPNIHVPWKFVEAVRIYSQDNTNCPICLSPPIVGKAGRCGHAHCFSCVLRLLNISEYPQCPVCNCAIHLSDLRSIITGKEQRPRLTQKLEFVKMTRSKYNMHPSIYKPVIQQTASSMPWLDRYQRVIGVTKDELMKNITDREEIELIVQRNECEDSEIPFVEQAQALVQQRIDTLKNSPSKSGLSPAINESDSIQDSQSQKNTPADSFRIKNPNIAEISSNSDDSEENQTEKTESYFFYQCSDGSPTFISSLNAKCLINQFGSIKEAPETIEATVLEIEDFTMDHELRRRFRYLSHLSDGQSFSLVLLDSRNLNLNEETFLKFKNQITARNKKRVQKDKEESKATKKIEEFYDRELYGKYAPAQISLSSHEMFPDFDPDSTELASEESQGLNLDDQVLSPTWVDRNKKVINVSDDYFPSLGSQSVAPGQTGSFWGNMKTTKLVKPNCSTTTIEPDLDSEYTPPVTTDIGSGIAEAIEAAKKNTQTKPKRGQKKKKGTKIAF